MIICKRQPTRGKTKTGRDSKHGDNRKTDGFKKKIHHDECKKRSVDPGQSPDRRGLKEINSSDILEIPDKGNPDSMAYRGGRKEVHFVRSLADEA